MMLSRGQKVIMRNGEILTVKSLEFNEFVPEERSEYIPKREIKHFVSTKKQDEATGKRPYAQPNAQRRSIYTDDETWAKLKAMGKGNASAGIREAVKRAEGETNETSQP